MDGYFQSKDCCPTHEGAWVLKNSGLPASKSKGCKGGKGSESCPICLGYCCGPNPYNGRSKLDDGQFKGSVEWRVDAKGDGWVRQELYNQVL